MDQVPRTRLNCVEEELELVKAAMVMRDKIAVEAFRELDQRVEKAERERDELLKVAQYVNSRWRMLDGDDGSTVNSSVVPTFERSLRRLEAKRIGIEKAKTERGEK